MTNISNEAWLKDTASSDAIGNGQPIYLRGVSITYGFENIIAYNPKIMQDSSLLHNARLSNTTYIGFEQPVISIQGLIDLNNTDGELADDEDKQIMTIGRLFAFGKRASTYQFWDSRILKSLINENDNNVEKPYTESMSVVVANIKISSSSKSINQVSYTIELKEDKVNE